MFYIHTKIHVPSYQSRGFIMHILKWQLSNITLTYLMYVGLQPIGGLFACILE